MAARAAATLLLIAAVSGGLLTPAAAESPSPSDAEAAFISLIGSARSDAGVAPVGRHDDLADVARRHAARMAAAHDVFHNPNLGSEVSGWREVGENVGRGSSPGAVHEAFMGSAAHRATVLQATYRDVGVGVIRGDDGLLYVSEVFRTPATAQSAPPAAPAAPAAPAITSAPPPSTTALVASTSTTAAPAPSMPPPTTAVAAPTAPRERAAPTLRRARHPRLAPSTRQTRTRTAAAAASVLALGVGTSATAYGWSQLRQTLRPGRRRRRRELRRPGSRGATAGTTR